MSDESAQIQPLLDDLRRGEPSAIGKLTELTYDRLRRLAGKILNQSFAPVGQEHELDSVLNTTYVRLHESLVALAGVEGKLSTPADFFRFAAFKVRQVLLDMVSKDRRLTNRRKPIEWGAGESGFIPPSWWQDKGPSPEAQARWKEFLERVEGLPEFERDMFEMHYIMRVPQAEIAKELNLPPKRVSRACLKAAAAVGKYMPA